MMAFHSSGKGFSQKISRHSFVGRALALCLALLLLAGLVPLASAAEGGDEPQNVTVRIGWYRSSLFQEGISDDAEKSGYSYEYIHKVSDYNEWIYEYVYGDWTELLAKLKAGEIDILAGVSKTEERLGQMLFPDEVMGYEHYVLYQHKGDSMDAADISTFTGKKIGAITDNLMTVHLEDWLEKAGSQAEIVYYDSFEKRDADFAAGTIDALVTTNNGVLVSSGYAQVVEVGKESYYLAVAKNREDLLKDLNRALSSMLLIEPYFITNLEYENYGTNLANSSLTAREEAWLEQHDTVKMGYLEDYLPYCATNENGKVYGLITDVMDAIRKELGITDRLGVSYVPYASGAEMMEALKKGEIDAAFPVGGTTWQLEQDGISATNDVVTASENLAYSGTFGDEKTNRIAVARGNAMSNAYVRAQFPEAELVECDSIEDCLQAVLEGKADSTLLNGLRTDIVKQNKKYSSLSLKLLSKTDGRGIGIAYGNTGLHMLLNRGLLLIGSDFGNSAAYNYIPDLYQVTLADFVFDHIWIAIGGGAFILVLIAVFAAVDHARNKRFLRMNEEKNRELSAQKEQLENLSNEQKIRIEEIIGLNNQLEENQRRLEEFAAELNASKEKAEAASKAKTSFLFNMSHDIRTPMNAIMGFRDLLEKHQTEPEKRADYLMKIKDSSAVLLSIINNVLEMARIEKGTLELDEIPCSVEAFFGSLESVFKGMMKQKNIELTTRVNVEHPYVYADSVKLREIYMNLLSNAYKYTNPGGTVNLSVDELPSDKEGMAVYRVTVADTGIGMSKDFLPHVFEEFARENNTTDAKVEGTGLGMPIVKRLVEMMDGAIEVRSEKGKGTTFTVTIPHHIAEEPARTEQNGANENVETNRFAGKRILLAEDNDLNAEIAIELIGEEGFIIDRAEDGAICVDMLKKAEPGYYALILMDIQMPNMNGYEAARAIRAMEDPEKANIPIIAMTANAFEEDRKNAFAAGMNAHLAKPVDIPQLRETLADTVK